MNSHASTGRVGLRRGLTLKTWLLIAIALLATLDAVVFGIRLTSLLRHGDLYLTSGGEAASIYGIWKVQKGYPLYEWPFAVNFPLFPYNYLFYFSYARILAALGARGPSLPIAGSALTLFFALFGAYAQWRVMRLVLSRRSARNPCVFNRTAFPEERRSPAITDSGPGLSTLRRTISLQNEILLAVLAAVAWLGSGMVSWWALTVRPDIAAGAFATGGLLAYMVGSREDQRSWILLTTASVLFYLAWTFKQSTICTLAGTCLFVLVYRRNIRQAIQLIAPCGCLMGLTAWIGGTNYWANVFVGPAINPWSLSRAAHTAVLAFFPSIFFWAFWVFAFGATPTVFKQRAHKDESGLLLLCFVVCLSLAIEFIYLGRAGCSRNSLLEAFTASATLSSCTLVEFMTRVTDSCGRRAVAVGAALILSMAVLPAAQLVQLNRFSVLSLASNAEYAQKRRFVDCLQSAPKPLLTRDEMFSLPWLSTADTYPAYVILWDMYDAARNKGLMKGGPDELIGQRRFGSLLLNEGDPFLKEALEVGYRYSPVPSCSGWQTLKLLSRSRGEKADSSVER
jgi:hypothetical protein